MENGTLSMVWASALSTEASLETALRQVVADLRSQLDPGGDGKLEADLALVFVSSAFTSEFPRLLPLLQTLVEVPALVGCSGGGVIGMDQAAQPQEIEDAPALSLTLARLPGVTAHSFHLNSDDLPDLDSPPGAWAEMVGVDPACQPQFVLLTEPFASGVNDLLQGLDFAYPGAAKIGGLASIDSFSQRSGLFCNHTLHNDGIVGVALWGDIALDTIVAQGCRPIGRPYEVGEAQRNVMLSLVDPDQDNQAIPPLDVLKDLFQTLSEEDRKLAQNALFVGVAQDSFKLKLEAGDFLIRTLVGVDPKIGALAVADRIRAGQRIQFHLRDAQTSAEDLETLLQRYQQGPGQGVTSAGALMFACNGRGQGLYQEANFDSRLFQRHLGATPLSGFFCNGEIGPVGGTTFLHGFTAVVGICHQPSQLPSA